jgi:hypothetical protein
LYTKTVRQGQFHTNSHISDENWNLREYIITSNDLGEVLEIGLDHLLAEWLGIGEHHGDEHTPLRGYLRGRHEINPQHPIISPSRGCSRRSEAGEPPRRNRRGSDGAKGAERIDREWDSAAEVAGRRRR